MAITLVMYFGVCKMLELWEYKWISPHMCKEVLIALQLFYDDADLFFFFFLNHYSVPFNFLLEKDESCQLLVTVTENSGATFSIQKHPSCWTLFQKLVAALSLPSLLSYITLPFFLDRWEKVNIKQVSESKTGRQCVDTPKLNKCWTHTSIHD